MNPEQVALRLGMSKHGDRRWSPCPSCGRKSRADESRPAVRLTARGFHCNACHAYGDAVKLASYGLGLDGVTRGKAYVKVMRWMEEGVTSVLSPSVEEEREWKRIDPMPALRCAVPLSRVVDPRLTEWLERRRISRHAPAGWLPRWRSEWWPWPVGMYSVVLPACTGAGAVESMHGVDLDTGRKVWPKGASSGALLFARREMRAWLAKRAEPPKLVIITEGAPDFLTYATDFPVLGVTSGGEHALRTVDFRGIKVFMATHIDKNHAGEKLQDKVAEAIFPATLRRLPFEYIRTAA